MQGVQNNNQSEHSFNKVPSTISVSVPTLPPWGQGFAETLVRDACILFAALNVAVLVLVRDLPWPVVAFMIVTFIASILVCFYHRRHLAERDLYENRLCEMTMELGEKNRALKELIQVDPLTAVLN